MQVIIIYKKFHDIERCEIMPEVFYIKENETPEDALRRIWQDKYNGLIAERLYNDDDFYDDPLDEENCWYEEDMAQIAWADGDTEEFYVAEVEDYK